MKLYTDSDQDKIVKLIDNPPVKVGDKVKFKAGEFEYREGIFTISKFELETVPIYKAGNNNGYSVLENKREFVIDTITLAEIEYEEFSIEDFELL